jgi:DNA replicative helicase MCM subunit Mcm2 (Cdc46/Mcm family)
MADQGNSAITRAVSLAYPTDHFIRERMTNAPIGMQKVGITATGSAHVSEPASAAPWLGRMASTGESLLIIGARAHTDGAMGPRS